MPKLTFSATIDAPKEKVWRTMLEDQTYRQWTSVFQEGSYAVTDWQPGRKALFLSPTGDGMVSRIAVHRPNEFLSIEHLGIVKHGVEDTKSDAVAGWAGAFENYLLKETNGVSALTVDINVTDEFREYFEDTFPKALKKLRELAEAR